MSCMSQNFRFSRIEFIRSNLSNFSAHVSVLGVSAVVLPAPPVKVYPDTIPRVKH